MKIETLKIKNGDTILVRAPIETLNRITYELAENLKRIYPDSNAILLPSNMSIRKMKRSHQKKLWEWLSEQKEKGKF